MSGYLSHEEYVESARQQVVETAQAMLGGRVGFLVGSRRLAALRHEVNVAESDADFLTLSLSIPIRMRFRLARYDGTGARRR